MKKRIFSMILVCCILMLLAPTTVFAGSNETPPTWNTDWLRITVIKSICRIDGTQYELVKGSTLSYGTDYTVTDVYYNPSYEHFGRTFGGWVYKIQLTESFLSKYMADDYWNGHKYKYMDAALIEITVSDFEHPGSYEIMQSTDLIIYFTCDEEEPVISGLEAGKTYCKSVTFSATDDHLESVSYKEEGSTAAVTLTPDSNGRYTIQANGENLENLTVTAKDTSGNQTAVTGINVNAEHSPDWVTKNGQYWKVCWVCGTQLSNKQDVSKYEIVIQGADTVCDGHDYTFTFTLPKGLSNPNAGFSSDTKAYQLSVTDSGNGIYTVTVDADNYKAENGNTTLIVMAGGCNEEGYMVTVSKTVDIKEHTGGTPTCTDKAKCERCGEEYGEPLGHSLIHAEAKEATTEAEGNTEYWYCERCGKYFSDNAAKNEITLSDTVIAKKTDSTVATPKTGDAGDMKFILALLLISGIALTFTGVYGRKQNRL